MDRNTELLKQKAEAQMREWRGRLETWQAQLDQKRLSAQHESQATLQGLRDRMDRVRERMRELETRGRDAQGELRTRFENGWKELEEGFENAKKRFER